MRLRQGNDVKMTMPMEHSKPLPQWCIFIYLKIRIWFTLISILAINIACYVWMLADDGVIWFAFLVHSQCLLTARKKTMCNECVLYLCRICKQSDTVGATPLVDSGWHNLLMWAQKLQSGRLTHFVDQQTCCCVGRIPTYTLLFLQF